MQRQPKHIQRFLLQTSVLGRLCGPLCDAVLSDPDASGQASLAYLEQANLFLIPLDNERRWYCYHHLFAEVLRQHLHQRGAADPGCAAALSRCGRADTQLARVAAQGSAGRQALAVGDLCLDAVVRRATHCDGQQCLQLIRRIASVDTSASYALLLARLHLAQGDLDGAAAVLDTVEAFVGRCQGQSPGHLVPGVSAGKPQRGSVTDQANKAGCTARPAVMLSPSGGSG